jgi:hypothetical protein
MLWELNFSNDSPDSRLNVCFRGSSLLSVKQLSYTSQSCSKGRPQVDERDTREWSGKIASSGNESLFTIGAPHNTHPPEAVIPVRSSVSAFVAASYFERLHSRGLHRRVQSSARPSVRPSTSPVGVARLFIPPSDIEQWSGSIVFDRRASHSA